ncbi:Flp pilus assembly protein CpaB [Undibacterium sp. SXout20W]|uniref:Flp pilus assembly protein CpaB n=1 Tax=Undibacterium sp. SXout20W TaxID=3413051 RepID=UPI003BF2A175
MKIQILKKIKPNKTWLVLGLAIFIGLLAALAARGYLKNQLQEIEERKKGQTINLVVAKSDIKKGSKLSSENLAVRPIPVEYAQSYVLRPDEFSQIDGQTIAYDIKNGEMISWSLLESKKPPIFSTRVTAGHRAMTVPVDEVNSISGMLEPGDSIDLIVTVTQKEKKLIFPLLQNAQIMATGQRNIDDPQGIKKEYSTVTLNVTEQEAQYLIGARESGKITALLRNPQDKRTAIDPNFDIGAALGLKSGLDISSQDGLRKIPVIYSAKEITPETAHLNTLGQNRSANSISNNFAGRTISP